jgi:anaerobic selenocysteine-containing dehydrogenase
VEELARRLRDAHGRIVMISRPLSGAGSAWLGRFMEVVGGRLYWYDPAAEVPLRTAVEHLFGWKGIPHYDVSGADYLLSFGAPFLDQWLSPVSYGVAFGRMRQARKTVRGRFVHVEPRLSLTAANADQWIPIRPGTEGLLALALGRLILSEAPGRVPASRRKQYEGLFSPVSPATIARQTDVDEASMRRLAIDLAAARRPLVLGGGPVSAHTNATAALIAINSLNGLLGNIGESGGVRHFESPVSPPSIPWLTERVIGDLAAEFEAGRASVLLVNDCNPVFGMAPAVAVNRVFSHASFVASFGRFLDESSSLADLVCADHHWLEAWGEDVPNIAFPVQTLSLRQPAVRPLYDTRQSEDVMLDVARRLAPDRVPWKSVHEWVRTHWGRTINEDVPESDDAWMRRLQQGGSWSAPARPVPPKQLRPHRVPPAPSFMGDAQDFPFLMYPYVSMTVGYGGAHLPWLQELPDTLTTAMWGTWVEINPATAAKLGVTQGDIVRLESLAGSLEAPVLLYPGLRPDVLAVPVGQGHSGGTRYERGRGANPLRLAVAAFDEDSGAFAPGATRVRLQTTGRKGRIVLLQQPAVDAADLIRIDSRPG